MTCASPARLRPRDDRLHRERGFTLIELLIAVAVIGILASIAVPSYQNYVKNSRVTDGQSKLMELAGQLERCYTESYDYSKRGDGSACVTLPINSDGGYYQISGSPSGSSFTLTATHSGTQVKESCKVLTVNQAGKTSPDSGCW